MADAGFFRGTTTDQDNRFSDKEKKLLKTMKFEDNLGVKVDMSKVKVDVLKPWITKRVYEILKMEDDVVVVFVFENAKIAGREVRVELERGTCATVRSQRVVGAE